MIKSVLGLAFSALLVAIAGTASASERIRIGVVDHYVPFSSFSKTGQPQGFEIDLASALCEEMKVECRFIKAEWNDIIPALMARQFDAIFASMSITEERKQVIAFTQRYYRTGAAFAVTRTSNIRDTSPKAMNGRLIGVISNTVQSAYLDRVYKPAGAVTRHYSSIPEQQYDLVRGRIDALLMDQIALEEWLEKTPQGGCCVRVGEIKDPSVIGEGIGVGLRKEDTALKERFNAAISAVLANGVYQQINDKYFSFSVY